MKTSKIDCSTRSCEKHGEYIPRIIRFGNSVLYTSCPDCVEENQGNERKRHYENTLEKTGIPRRFEESRFETYKPSNEAAKEIKTIMQKYTMNFSGIKPYGTSLIFSGPPGTGKTHISCSVALGLINQGETVLYSPFFDIVSEIKSTYKSDIHELTIIRKYQNVSLLIIDEVGVQCSNNFEKDLLFRIIDGRYSQVKPTILITNLNEKDLSKIIGERIIDRFKENKGGLYNFNWESYRK